MTHLQKIRKDRRRYIICGDWNIAHKEIDLKNWRSNQKNSGFLPEERAWLDRVFGEVGFRRRLPARQPGAGAVHVVVEPRPGLGEERRLAHRLPGDLAFTAQGRARGEHLQAQALLRPRAAHHGLRRLSGAGGRPAVVAWMVGRGARLSPAPHAGDRWRSAFPPACRSCWCSRRCRPGCGRRASIGRPSACSPGSGSSIRSSSSGRRSSTGCGCRFCTRRSDGAAAGCCWRRSAWPPGSRTSPCRTRPRISTARGHRHFVRRVLRCDPGHRRRCLAHRIGSARDAGRHGGGLPVRLPDRDAW